MPFDTSAEAKQVQAESLRRLTGAERLRIAFELSRATRQLALAGLKKRRCEASEQELIIALIELCYGRAILERASR